MLAQVTVREARAHLTDLLGRAEKYHERTIVTVHGKPTAVILSIDDFESLMETLDVLGDPETMAAIAESERDIAEGRGTRITPGMTLEDLRRIDAEESVN